MSVPVPKRNESTMEFLNTAKVLDIKTIEICKTYLPKRYTFLVATHLTEIAGKIHQYVVCGNSVYPQNAEEVQMRRNYFVKARANVYALVAKIEVVASTIHPPASVIEEWTALCHTEIKSLTGILESDNKRYKQIK